MKEIQYPPLLKKQLLLFCAPRKYLHRIMPQIIAGMAIKGELFVVDAGNTFRPYTTAREIRRLSDEIYPKLENIKLSRVFTCYQVLTRLETLEKLSIPLLILDLLDMFYDEHTSAKERERLLIKSLDCIKRFSLDIPVAISCPQSKNGQYPAWIGIVRNYADEIFQLESVPTPQNYRLF